MDEASVEMERPVVMFRIPGESGARVVFVEPVVNGSLQAVTMTTPMLVVFYGWFFKAMCDLQTRIRRPIAGRRVRRRRSVLVMPRSMITLV